MVVFIGLLGIQGICFLILPHATAPALFAVLAALIYLCYGGGFGTMPATAGDYFGLRNAGAIYGLMIIAWSLGGVIGPLLVANLIQGKAYTVAFTTIGLIALVGTVLPMITRSTAIDRPAAPAAPPVTPAPGGPATT
jgi:OFA family oxalate/formate antiporter-like MFS transporter